MTVDLASATSPGCGNSRLLLGPGHLRAAPSSVASRAPNRCAAQGSTGSRTCPGSRSTDRRQPHSHVLPSPKQVTPMTVSGVGNAADSGRGHAGASRPIPGSPCQAPSCLGPLDTRTTLSRCSREGSEATVAGTVPGQDGIWAHVTPWGSGLGLLSGSWKELRPHFLPITHLPTGHLQGLL